MKLFDHYKNLSKSVYIIAFSTFINRAGTYIWPLLALILKTKVGLNEAQISLFISISIVLTLITGFLGGHLSDVFGKKKTIALFESLAILVFFSVIFVPMGIMTAYLLLLGQLLHRTAGPAHGSLMANITKSSERESAFSLNYLAINIGTVIGPAIGGLLLQNHFKLFMGLDVLTSSVAFVLLMVFVKEVKDKEIDNEFEESTTIPVLQVMKERPIIPAFGLLGFFGAFLYGQLNLAFPLYIESLFGNDGPVIMGFIYSTNGLVVVVMISVLTYIMRKQSALTKIFIGHAIYVTSYLLLAFNTSMLSMFLITIYFTLGEIVMILGSSPIMSKIVPENLLGRAQALNAVFYSAGNGLAALLIGGLLSTDFTYKTVWMIVSLIGLVGLFYIVFFKKTFGHIIEKVDQLDRNRSLA